ncbi:glyoxalase [Bacillus atrophaeus]|uniref:glyoxalase n=1 Tax=Bacillus atrophaeus TaxID=1452 RepID=UPI00227F2717|nr:glyoxalase [Bacillus atrophaeus]MCY9135231.1 glyoxalase [Bacillus atrophaeus]MED4828574.1 glyoxalase [Bacillus atrophaeus]
MFISKVTLYSNEVDQMRHFYVHELGFPLIESSEDAFSIKAGCSELEIRKSHSDEEPFYHFAFNIPQNKFKEAKTWAKSKVTLHKEDDEDEVYFEHSDAYSLYFSDPSHNIVEFIARNSSAASEENFSVQSVINISEINITTNDVMSAGKGLNQFGVPVRYEESVKEDGLNFMGEYEEGAFLLLGPRGRRWIFSDKKAEVYPLSITINQVKNIEIDSKGEIRFTDCRDIPTA